MKQGQVLVEGQTEERVVNEWLRPYLEERGLVLVPKLVTTKRTIGAAHHKGGVRRYGKVQGDLQRLLGNTGLSVVTTLFDYYALPTDFPGMADRPARRAARSHVEHVEAAWATEVRDRRFIPHIVLHELEAWVFADPARLAAEMFNEDEAAVAAITAIARTHVTPEDIDDGPATAPSKRLARAFPPYQKTSHGVTALKAIGVEGIYRARPHAAAWLDQLVAVAQAPSR
jgi:uncharacterized protein DUF4276